MAEVGQLQNLGSRRRHATEKRDKQRSRLLDLERLLSQAKVDSGLNGSPSSSALPELDCLAQSAATKDVAILRRPLEYGSNALGELTRDLEGEIAQQRRFDSSAIDLDRIEADPELNEAALLLQNDTLDTAGLFSIIGDITWFPTDLDQSPLSGTLHSAHDTFPGTIAPPPVLPHLQCPTLGSNPLSADFNELTNLDNYTQNTILPLLEDMSSEVATAVPYHGTSNRATVSPLVTHHFPDQTYLRLARGIGMSSEHDEHVSEVSFAEKIIRRLRLQNTEQNGSMIKVTIQDRHTMRDIFLAGLRALGNRNSAEGMPSPSRRSPSPSLYRNNLSLVRTSTLRAYLANAEILGISIPELYRDNCPSRFHQPHFTPLDNEDSALAGISNGITPHLKPTRPQLCHPHPPWLDLIPFPTMRERAITLMTTSPPLLNILELKTDVLLNEGIFCWNVDGKKSGQPWDMRSWEAAPWFLKKWWLLLDGEEGEIWKQTQWWRGMRGEENVTMD
ncbi:hypothetical protein MMC11_001433 [Xylographa trunciseda]|nr:hypothetical protein [Xylographa trunciseda]